MSDAEEMADSLLASMRRAGEAPPATVRDALSIVRQQLQTTEEMTFAVADSLFEKSRPQ